MGVTEQSEQREKQEALRQGGNKCTDALGSFQKLGLYYEMFNRSQLPSNKITLTVMLEVD